MTLLTFFLAGFQLRTVDDPPCEWAVDMEMILEQAQYYNPVIWITAKIIVTAAIIENRIDTFWPNRINNSAVLLYHEDFSYIYSVKCVCVCVRFVPFLIDFCVSGSFSATGESQRSAACSAGQIQAHTLGVISLTVHVIKQTRIKLK